MSLMRNFGEAAGVVPLTRQLLSFQTVNPPGDEAPAAAFLANLLGEAGFRVSHWPMGENRSNMIADLPGASAEPPLIFSGHLDTVPLGNVPWTHDPFTGEVDNGAIYGRGTSDMKGGIAAMVCAALGFATKGRPRRTLRIVLTAGEETGCIGAAHLRTVHALGEASGVLIAEPTANYPALGHKGALFMRATTTGVTAHSSMPEKGVNAIYKAARGICALENFRFDVETHALLGNPTLNVGMISGGLNVNSVPDHAEFTIDVRTVAGMKHEEVLHKLQQTLGDDVSLDPFVSLLPLTSRDDHPFVRLVSAIAAEALQTSISPRTVSFFTDGCVFSEVSSCPVVILGPGQTEMAHKTDEYCLVSKLEQACEIYSRILDQWCA